MMLQVTLLLVALEGVTVAVSYTHLRAHETVLDLVCRLLLEKKNNKETSITTNNNTDNTQITNQNSEI